MSAVTCGKALIGGIANESCTLQYTYRKTLWRRRFSVSFGASERALDSTRQWTPHSLAYPEKVHARKHEQDLSTAC